MMRRATAPLIILTLLLPVAIIGLACGGGESVQPPTSATTPTASPPTPTAQEVDETLGHYENTELGFAFDYPDHWELITVGDPAIEVGETDTVASIAVGTLGELTALNGMNVTVNRLVGVADVSEDEIFEAIDDLVVQLAGQLGGVIEEKDWTEVAGLKARRHLLNFTIPGVSLTSERVNAVRGDLHFILDCQGEQARFQEVRAGCQVILDSFEFTTGQ